MRIALCFSGQIRTGIEVSKSVLNFIDTPHLTVDFFIHTWDIESKSPHDVSKHLPYIRSGSTYPLDMTKIDKIKDIYKPKKIVVSNYDEYQKSINSNPRFIDNEHFVIPYVIPLYQSAYESNKLKMEYEKENNFKYDFVVKSRFDCAFYNYQKLIEEVKFIKNRFRQSNIKEIYVNDHWNKLPGMMEDIFWIGESEIMDIICNFIDYQMDMETDPPPDRQILMYNYVTKKLGISIHSMKYNNLKIVR
jgi:hypothetical protein